MLSRPSQSLNRFATMAVVPSSKVTFFRLVSPRKGPFNPLVPRKDLGILMEVSCGQSPKAAAASVSRLAGSVTSLSTVQNRKALSPMEVSASGRSNACRLVQP